MLRLLAIPLSLSAAASFAQSGPPSYCQSLAAHLNMKPVASRAAEASPKEWRVNLLGGLGPALFGGSAVVSFSVRPVEDSLAERQRLENACDTTKAGAICKIEGPARVTIGTKSGQTVSEIRAGRRAEIEMRKTTIHCRDVGNL